MKLSVGLLVVLLSCAVLCEECSPEQFYRVAKRHGYPIETHRTRTEDGFHLTMFRLQKGEFRAGLPVVFIQHGFTQSAEGWVINDKKNSLTVKLVEAGFDVWLGNSRGTKYSLENDFHDISSQKYWEFSFQQMGLFDVPAHLKYVITHTGADSLTYVGHSQGTSQLFAALSDPKTSEWVNKHVKHFVALAPIAYMNHFKSELIRDVSLFRQGVVSMLKLLKKWQIEKNNCSPSELNIQLYKDVCSGSSPTFACLQPYKLTDQYPEVNNLPLTGYFVNSKPQSFALQILDHFSQLINAPSPQFKRFDYGTARNLVEYGQPHPPEFDLSLIKTKVTALVGTGDTFSTPEDVNNLKSKIPQMQIRTLERWGHSTFMVGAVTGEVYDQLVNDLVAQS